MQSFKAYLDKLVSFLDEIPYATIHNDEDQSFVDSRADLFPFGQEGWSQIKFAKSNDKLTQLKENFIIELTNNSYSTFFNFDLYCHEAISKIRIVSEKYISININDLDINTRNDFIIRYLDYFELIYDDPNEPPYSMPVELVLAENEFVTLPIRILVEISNYFEYQKQTIIDLLSELDRYHKPKIKRKYNSGYSYQFFKFDHAKVGRRRSFDECIETFFSTLISEGYISGEDCLNSLKKSFDDQESLFKVIWEIDGSALYYLIKKLNNNYIFDAKGSITNIIPKIFAKPDGSNFEPDELYSRHLSKTLTRKLDRIILILKQ